MATDPRGTIAPDAAYQHQRSASWRSEPVRVSSHMLRSLLLLATVTTGLLAEDFTAKLVGISGGDTIRVIRGGRAERVRLWDIDCPESKQPFGRRAKQFTGDLAFAKTVTVRPRHRPIRTRRRRDHSGGWAEP